MKLIAQALAGAVLVLSSVLAFRLGITWGLTEWERSIYGSLVVLFEGLKCLLPFAVVAAWRAGRVAGAVVAAILFAGLVTLSFLGTLGFAELNRGALQGTREHSVAEVARLRADIAQLSQRIEGLGSTRALTEIDAEIETILRGAVKGAPDMMLGARTGECSKLAGAATVEPCMRVGQLRRERAEAAARDGLRADIEGKRQRLSQAGGLDLAGIADPHVAVIARVSGLTTNAARLAANIAFALLLELVGGLGFYIASLLPGRLSASDTALSTRSSPAAEAMPGDEPVQASAQRYLRTQVRRDASRSVTASAMHRDYARWCTTQRVTPMTLTAFGAFIAREGIEKSKVEGLVRYRGVALNSEAA